MDDDKDGMIEASESNDVGFVKTKLFCFSKKNLFFFSLLKKN
jgi:hypothetical protein